MGMTSASRQITRVVSDGTGLTPEEVWLVVTAAAVATTVRGLLHAVDLVTDLWHISMDGDWK